MTTEEREEFEELEELLPAYLDGALDPARTARVAEWLERSPRARASLEAYRSIDAVLESRRELVPDAASYLRAAFRRPLPSRARDVMVVMFGLPGVTTMLLGLFTVALFLYRDRLAAWFGAAAPVPGAESLGLGWVRDALLAASGVDIWTLTAVYAGVTVLVLVSTSVMLMRFLRD